MQESVAKNFRLEKCLLKYCSNPSMSRTSQDGQIIIGHEDLLRRRLFRMHLRQNIQITLTSVKTLRYLSVRYYPVTYITVSHFSYAPPFQGPHFLTKMLESNSVYDNLFIDILSV